MKNSLTVHEMPVQDSWKDMVRIPHKYRVDPEGRGIRRGTICRVSIGGKHKLLTVRGCRATDPRILLDSPTRIALGKLQAGTLHDVELRPVGSMGYWRWAWGAADPAYRVPAQISLISLVLGIIGLVLGILGVWPLAQGLLTSGHPVSGTFP